MPVLTADKIPTLGAHVTRETRVLSTGVSHDCAATSVAAITDLTSHTVPQATRLSGVIRGLASVEVVTFLSRLSTDQIGTLRAIHNAPDLNPYIDFMDQVAEGLYLAHSKQITMLNYIGPERWRGVLSTPDAIVGKSFLRLPDADKALARSNVLAISRALASLPEESLLLVKNLKDAAPSVCSSVSPLSTLRDHVLKRAVSRNFDAWRVRKELSGVGHDDAKKTLHELPPANRLFASLMGLATFQMLRDLGREGCLGLIVLGERLNQEGEVSREELCSALNSAELITGIPFRGGRFVGLPRESVLYLASAHHDLWLTNRALSSLLPEELRQPHREEHRPFSELSRFDQNQVCLGVLCLAMSLARDALDRDQSVSVRDLLGSAAPGNPKALSF